MTQDLIVEQPCRLEIRCPDGLPGPGALELLKYLFSVKGKAVLDVRSGTGLYGIAAMKLGARSAALLDDRPVALDVVRENARRNAVALDLKLEDGLEDLNDLYDLIIAVPPQLPAPPGVRGPRFGGPDGLRRFEELLPSAFDRLEKGGQLLTSLTSLAERPRFETLLSDRFRFRVLPSVEESLPLDDLRRLHPTLVETLEERRAGGLSEFTTDGSRLTLKVRPYFVMRL